ncbi:MAG: hypothetical protein ABF876_08765 [Acetobacter aceti]|uniref:Lipoprotein n=1 Tax=Acetobacter aceti TaxID=435 RepID=A0A1U9KE78_ACEAC|nr:hypothetical protein [Acetobacter aceti]AQS84047.1 hypothetical protein A0U92_03865 [Acetobacter aceti]
MSERSSLSRLTGLFCLVNAMSLTGCARYEQTKREVCSQEKPDTTLLRQPTLADFIRSCGLQYYPDATGQVTLHYTPPRHDDTLPVSAPKAFAVSDAGGSRGRLWYLCMPVPYLVSAGQPVRSFLAVCRYAGSGMDRMSLTYDQTDAVTYNPRNW